MHFIAVFCFLKSVLISTNLIRVAYHVALKNVDSKRISKLKLQIAESFISSAVDLLEPLFDFSEFRVLLGVGSRVYRAQQV